MTDIDENLFNEFFKTLNLAVEEGYKQPNINDRDYNFYQELKHNVAVFSAFKVHRFQNDIAGKLIDEDGNLKPFNRFLNDVKTITSHQCKRWLQTEYDTAVIRAHQAADWKQFEAEADILPNLEWIKSTSINAGADHQIYWGLVLPINHKFWDEHRPGDRWNCKCSLRSTNKPASKDIPDGSVSVFDKAAEGLDCNPGTTAEVFSDSHPYIKNAHKDAKEAVKKFIAAINIDKLVNSLKKNAQTRLIPPAVDGYKKHADGMVYESPWHGENERDDNLRVANILASKTKEKVFLLPRLDPKNPIQKELRDSLLPQGIPNGKNTDFLINGKLFEGKSLFGVKTTDRTGAKSAIENRIKKAKQQADNVILEIPSRFNRKHIREIVLNYISRTKKEREIWVIHKGKLIKYKKAPRKK